MLSVRALLLLAAALVALASAGNAQDASPPQAVVVIDGSGSMWGNLGTEKSSKIDLVRGAVRQALQGTAPSAKIALMSFGQRRRADCSDVEVIAPLEAGPIERVLTPVDKLNPKGKGPLTLALKEAAKLIPAGTPGSITVVHDGPDNCWQDVCAAAAEIAKSNAKVVVNLVGLGLERADAQKLMCVPQQTNGRLIEVRDHASLNAGVAEAIRLARLDQGSSPPSADRSRPSEVKEPRLDLSARLSASGGALSAPVSWRVNKDSASGERIVEATSPSLSLKIAPGKYWVEARYGLARAEELVQVSPETATQSAITLEAGTLKVSARATKAQDPLADPIITVYALTNTAADKDSSSGAPVLIGRAPDSETVVPKGDYRVIVEDGLARGEASVSVASGGTAEANVALGTGRLELSAASAGGEAVKDVLFALAVDDPDAPQGRREVARSAAPAPSFTLAAGTYYLTSRYGTAEARDRLAVGSGATVKHVVTFDAARLSVDVQLDAMTAAAKPAVLIRVLKTQGARGDGRVEVARSSGQSVEFVLPPQHYIVEAELAGENVRSETPADLSGGRAIKIPLKLEAGEVSISAAGPRVSRWHVKDRNGRVVLLPGPSGGRTGRLAPGAYVVQSNGGAPQIQRSFEVRPGERQTIELQSP